MRFDLAIAPASNLREGAFTANDSKESFARRFSVPYNGRRSKENDNGRISSNQ